MHGFVVPAAVAAVSLVVASVLVGVSLVVASVLVDALHRRFLDSRNRVLHQ